MFHIHPQQNGFDLSITGHFLEVHVSEDDETCLYCHCDVTRGQGVNTKNSTIQSVQADWIGRTYPPLFTINLPKEEEIIDDLREITTMEYVVQVIMIIVCIAIVIIIMYFCCTKCRHTHTIFKYCFPFLPISRIVRTSRRKLIYLSK